MASNDPQDSSVDQDMTRIFGAPHPRRLPVVVPPQRPLAQRRGVRRWTLVALPLAALAAVGMTAVYHPGANEPAAVRRSAAAQPVRSTPLPAAVPESAAAGGVETLAVDTPVYPGPAPAMAKQPAAAPPQKAADTRSPRRRLVLNLDPGTDSAPAARSRSGSRAEPCDDDRCIYQDVINADRRLRSAYRRAGREGVPVAELQDVRRQWNRALSISLDAPDETIRRYDRLTRQLEAASDREDQ